jgi:hypothetical protein
MVMIYGKIRVRICFINNKEVVYYGEKSIYMDSFL